MPELPPTGLYEPEQTPPAASRLLHDTPQPSTVVEQARPHALPPHQPTAGVAGYGRYTVLKGHAQGGLGKVSLAKDTKLGRTVALKEIRPDRRPSPEALQRFVNEAAITGLLEHPGIVPIYSLDEDETGKPYYAMRFIEGQSLQKALDAYHAQPDPVVFRKLLTHFIAVCNAIGYAHSKGVIHRDLKPDNVMLGDYGETLVVDWGLAKCVGWALPTTALAKAPVEPAPAGMATPQETIDYIPDGAAAIRELTRAGQVMGTPAYMSPEQARGEIEALGPATDIYALGGILFALLTGRPSFRGGARDVLRQLQDAAAPPSAVQVKKEAPPALAAVCAKAMARLPADRYLSATVLAAEVEHWLADEPTTAYAEPWVVRTRRWVKKRRTLVVSGTVLLLSAVVATAVVAVVIAILGEQKRQELTEEQKNTEKRRVEAVTARDEARKAVRTLSSKEQLQVYERQEKLTPAQVEQLRALVAFYRKCAQEVPQTEEELIRQGEDYTHLGWMLFQLRQYEEAFAAYGQSLAILQKLAIDHPTPETQGNLAAAWHNLGLTQMSMRRLREAQHSLQEALRAWQPVVQRPDAHPDDLFRLATTWYNLGELQERTGQPQTAETSYGQTRPILEKLAAAHPAHPRYQVLLGATWNNLARLQRLGRRLKEAEASHAQALRLKELLAAAHPTAQDIQGSLLVSAVNYGLLQLELGQVQQAEANFQRACNLGEQLVAAYPVAVLYQENLAEAYSHLGRLQHQNRQPTLALAAYQRARVIREKLLAASPTDAKFRTELALTNKELGTVQVRLNQGSAAEASWERARLLFERLAKEYPDAASHGVNLAAVLCELGNLKYAQGHGAATLSLYDQGLRTLAVVLRHEPDRPLARLFYRNIRSNRATILRNQGRYAEAARDCHEALPYDDGSMRTQISRLLQETLTKGFRQATFQAHSGWYIPALQSVRILAPLVDLPADTWPQLARVLALCSASPGSWFLSPPTPYEREQYAVQAVEMLQRGRATGFFAATTQAEQWRRDADLRTLHDREGFRRLLRQIRTAGK